MKKEEFLSILKIKRQTWERKFEVYSDPDYAEFYGILSRVSLLEYVISLVEQLEC